MADRETKANRKKRRQELIAQAQAKRDQMRAAGPELTGPQGVGAPRATGSEAGGRRPAESRKVPLPD